MRLQKMMVLSLLCSSVLLTACATPSERLVLPRIPEQLKSCPDRPPVPDGDYTQKDVGVFTLRLAQAHETCKGRLAALNTLLDTTAAELEKGD